MLITTWTLLVLSVLLWQFVLRYHRVVKIFCRYANVNALPELLPLHIGWLRYFNLLLIVAVGVLLYRHVDPLAPAFWAGWILVGARLAALFIPWPSTLQILWEVEQQVNALAPGSLNYATIKVMWGKFKQEFERPPVS